jgi:iron complex transport system substrate-binding protein
MIDIKPFYQYAGLFLALVLIISCGNERTSRVGFNKKNSIPLAYATGFDVLQTSWGFVVTVFNPDENGSIKEQYGLSENILEVPDSLVAIKTPLTHVACLSTTHIPMFSQLEAFNAISGVAYARYIKDSTLHQLISSKTIMEIDGPDGLDTELLLSSKSKYLMVYPYEDEGYAKYEKYGTQLIYNAEYAEKHPLGKAEWIKFFGLLTNKWELSVKIFDKIAARYEATAELVKQTKEKPTVFAGSYFKSMWNAPNGNSLVAKLLEDAGANYIFESSDLVGNIILDKETFISKAVKADYWGRVVNNSQVVEWPLPYEMLQHFEAIKKQQSFYCNVSNTDYFGVGTLEPDVILKDLVAIFHPEVLESYQPTYFKSFTTDQYPRP